MLAGLRNVELVKRQTGLVWIIGEYEVLVGLSEYTME
jgi:hypothetical protein